jgi:hypothetical protein
MMMMMTMKKRKHCTSFPDHSLPHTTSPHMSDATATNAGQAIARQPELVHNDDRQHGARAPSPSQVEHITIETRKNSGKPAAAWIDAVSEAQTSLLYEHVDEVLAFMKVRSTCVSPINSTFCSAHLRAQLHA